MQFGSDNWSGVTSAVEEALHRANVGYSPAYGDDALTARVTRRFCDVFEREVAVLFVASGTAANLLCLQATARPSGFVLCSDRAHLFADEFNGPEFFTGMKLLPVATERRADDRRGAARDVAGLPPADQRGPVATLSLTNATEYGTTYAAAEVAELAAIATGARRRGARRRRPLRERRRGHRRLTGRPRVACRRRPDQLRWHEERLLGG